MLCLGNNRVRKALEAKQQKDSIESLQKKAYNKKKHNIIQKLNNQKKLHAKRHKSSKTALTPEINALIGK